MGERPWWLELAGGLAAAVVIPLLLGLTWGRFAPAGAITGISLAVLLHVTVLLAAVSLLYRMAEWLVRRAPVAAAAVAVAVTLGCAALTGLLVVD
jgi:Na+(H+)/acetate symporter ActP